MAISLQSIVETKVYERWLMKRREFLGAAAATAASPTGQGRSRALGLIWSIRRTAAVGEGRRRGRATTKRELEHIKHVVDPRRDVVAVGVAPGEAGRIDAASKHCEQKKDHVAEVGAVAVTVTVGAEEGSRRYLDNSSVGSIGCRSPSVRTQLPTIVNVSPLPAFSGTLTS